MFLSSNNQINVTLCGMMGSGKSVIGRKLAKEINFNFVDTDKLIEKEIGKSINKIFKEDGEEYFRKLEEKIILKILQKEKYVIALGGGSVESYNIRKFIKKNSFNVYLDVSIDILIKRLKNSKNRPLIQNTNINTTLLSLTKKREKFYNEANLIIKNDVSIANIIQKIKNKIK